MSERWLNVDEIAQHMGIAAITVYRWLEKGDIPAHRVGKLWRFKVSVVDRWIAAGGSDASIATAVAKNRADNRDRSNLEK